MFLGAYTSREFSLFEERERDLERREKACVVPLLPKETEREREREGGGETEGRETHRETGA